jgi:beta-xylosidase
MKRFFVLALFLSLSVLSLKAQSSDNGDGTFTNPVIWADCPDPDVIRVGEDFYFVSTTMHLMPGAPVMHSKDLVNWEIVSYIFDRIEETPRYSLQEGTVYGRGQWATSLRYRDGRFYAYFTPNDQPYKGYVYTTEDRAMKTKKYLRAHASYQRNIINVFKRLLCFFQKYT